MQDQGKDPKSAQTTVETIKQQKQGVKQIQLNNISQNLYELDTDIGKLTIQVISLKNYKWIVITNSNRLIVDGSLQLSMQTPFSDHPSVLDIGADQNQAQSQVLCKKIAKELGCPIVLSLNLQIGLNSANQMKIIKYLSQINKKIGPIGQKQINKMEEA